MSHSAISELSCSSPLINRRQASYDSYYDETDSSEVSDVFADIGIFLYSLNDWIFLKKVRKNRLIVAEIAIANYRSDESYASFESESHDESTNESEEMEEYSERSDEVSDIFAELC